MTRGPASGPALTRIWRHARHESLRVPDFVFATSNGTPQDARNVTRYFQAAPGRAGLPHQRFHDLRHGYATLMLEAGEELIEVSRSLGHANLSTTADVYGHITPAMRKRSAARMERVLAG